MNECLPFVYVLHHLTQATLEASVKTREHPASLVAPIQDDVSKAAPARKGAGAKLKELFHRVTGRAARVNLTHRIDAMVAYHDRHPQLVLSGAGFVQRVLKSFDWWLHLGASMCFCCRLGFIPVHRQSQCVASG